MSNSDITKLIETEIFPHMIADYVKFMPPTNEVRTNMFNDYKSSLTYKVGSKYVKVISETGGVKMFIVAVDGTKGFKRGDILKPASWAAPATNFARGNIFEGNFDRISWTGAG